MSQSRFQKPRSAGGPFLALFLLAILAAGLHGAGIGSLAVVFLLFVFSLSALILMINFLPDVFLQGATSLFTGIFYKLRVQGLDSIPADGPALLVCNHVSFVDWLIVVACVPRPVRFVIDHAFFRGWILKWILTKGGVIPIAPPREDRGRLGAAYDLIAAKLNAGEIVCIFPEGRITFDGKLGEFKPGVIKILKKTPVPVVPMALSGLWGSFFSRKDGGACRKWPKRFRAPIELKIGKAISPDQAHAATLRESVAALRGPGEPQ